MKKIILLTVILSSLFINSNYASHLVGGEISYECLGNNQYKIRLTVYRDCASLNINGQTTPFDGVANLTIFKGDGTFFNSTSPTVSVSYSTGTYPATLPITTYDGCTVPDNLLCIDKVVYETTLTLPMEIKGYFITYQRCCRSNILSNISIASQTGMTVTTFISEDGQQGCNSNPVFNEEPPVAFCANTPISVDAGATDVDSNTLIYSLCTPLIGGSPSNPMPNVAAAPPYLNVGYNGSFSATQPISGNLSIDSLTGLITGTSTAAGFYTLGVCVDEYDNGVWLGSYKRDFMIGVVNCVPATTAGIYADSINQSGIYVVNYCDTLVSFTTIPNITNLSYSYSWSFMINSDTVTSTTANPTIIFPGLGSYSGKLVVELDTFGCKDSIDLVVNIVIDNSLNVNFWHQYDSTIIDSIHFQSAVSSNDSIVGWYWDFGDGSSSTLENPIYQYQDTGIYWVILTVTTTKGCYKQIAKLVEWMPIPILNFTESLDLAENIILYPNPVNDIVHLKFNMPTFTNDYSVSIYNSIGQEVYYRNNINLTGGQFITIETEGLLEGTYFLKVMTRNKIQVLKFSVLK